MILDNVKPDQVRQNKGKGQSIRIGDDWFGNFDAELDENTHFTAEVKTDAWPDGRPRHTLQNVRIQGHDIPKQAEPPTGYAGVTRTVDQIAASQFHGCDTGLSIMTQAAFKALMENASDNIEHDVILDYASLSVRVAKGWDKALKAYQLGGDPRDALEQQKQEEQQATPEPEPFDDQIPF